LQPNLVWQQPDYTIISLTGSFRSGFLLRNRSLKAKLVDGKPLVIELYRKFIFERVLYTFDEAGRLFYTLALLLRAKKNFKSLDLTLAAFYFLFCRKCLGGNTCLVVAFVTSIAAMILASSLAAEAQQPEKVRRIGYLSGSDAKGAALMVDGFREGLRDLGYVEGKNIFVEYRYAEAKGERLPDLAAELVRLKVDVIVTSSTPAIQAVKEATRTIPIVMAFSGDPVGTGLVASLSKPGGNITGLSDIGPEITGKQLELLKEAFPTISRVAFLFNPSNQGNRLRLKATEVTAGELKVQIQAFEVRSATDFEKLFSAISKGEAQALMTVRDPAIYNNQRRILQFAAENRLPTMHMDSVPVEAGGLMSYGPNVPDLFRRAAAYVDKILKGAKPADLPVARPTKFELIVNLKTAKQLGLTIPQSILYRADKVLK
jgi:putative ABC transport system substrate-binding protein